MTAAIVTAEIGIAFGGVVALRGIDLTAAVGERLAIIGPNGAGKTTLFNVIGGQLGPNQGSIALFGTDITRKAPWERARLGLSRTFQISRLFQSLSVWDNTMLAAGGQRGLTPSSLWRGCSDRRISGRVEELLDYWGLADLRDEPVQNLAHGNQRLLEVALAFATGPKVVMLDEPTAGLSGGDREMITRRLSRLDRDVTILLVDHDMDVVFDLADRITVLNYGEVIAHGEPNAIRNDPRVHEIYFGEE